MAADDPIEGVAWALCVTDNGHLGAIMEGLTNMETVCWICGYAREERRKQGAEPGKCAIPREHWKDPKRCWMNAEIGLADADVADTGNCDRTVIEGAARRLAEELDPTQAATLRLVEALSDQEVPEKLCALFTAAATILVEDMVSRGLDERAIPIVAPVYGQMLEDFMAKLLPYIQTYLRKN